MTAFSCRSVTVGSVKVCEKLSSVGMSGLEILLVVPTLYSFLPFMSLQVVSLKDIEKNRHDSESIIVNIRHGVSETSPPSNGLEMFQPGSIAD